MTYSACVNCEQGMRQGMSCEAVRTPSASIVVADLESLAGWGPLKNAARC